MASPLCSLLDWVTAIGTVSAAVIALGIAVWGNVHARVEARKRARLAAAAMIYRLRIAKEVARACQAAATFGYPDLPREASDARAIADIQRMMKSRMFVPDSSQVEALIPIGRKISERIALAYALIHHVLQSVDAIGEGPLKDTLTAGGRAITLKWWARELSESVDLLNHALADCERTVDLTRLRTRASEWAAVE